LAEDVLDVLLAALAMREEKDGIPGCGIYED
jgi:hypothetical protein